MARRNDFAAFLVLSMFLVAACGPDTIFLRPALDTPAHHVKNGHSLLTRGKIDAAHAEFIRAKSLDEGYAPAYVGLALIQGHRGDVDGGFQTLEKATGQGCFTPAPFNLVAVVVRLEGTLHGDTQIVGLNRGERGQFHAQPGQVQPGHLFVQLFRQGVDFSFVAARSQFDLGQALVGEAVAHHEAGVAGGASQVHQPPFGQNDDRPAGFEGSTCPPGV
jgi:hypothetical protein